MFEMLMKGVEKNATSGDIVYMGLVSDSELINSTELSTLVGLTEGYINTAPNDWIKVNYRGKLLYVARNFHRTTVGASSLRLINIVDGNRIIKIKGLDYRIRLIRGGNQGSTAVTYDDVLNYDSEWNNIFYRLTEHPSKEILSKEGIRFAEWKNFQPSYLSIANGGNNEYTICMERTAGNVHLERGLFNVLGGYVHTSEVATTRNWRPVLELVG